MKRLPVISGQWQISRVAIVAAILFLFSVAADVQADEPLPTEDDYYQYLALPIPEGVVLEAGAIELLPEGKIAISSRRGEIWIVENGLTATPEKDAKFTRFAHGLHEVLGLAFRDGWLYATQRCDVSRLKDTNGDGRADLFEVVADDWGISGDYHEYAFGTQFDKEGHIWVTLCLTGSFSSKVEYRGWCVRVGENGEFIPTASGIRSPGGMGMNAEGEVFYTDNQGPWNGSCSLKHLTVGSFQGHPGGNRWYEITEAMGPKPTEPESGSRIMAEAKKIPEYMPPPVIFPYNKMGKSASGIACDTSGGKFGPFEDQLFVADQSHSTVMRVFLEKVRGRYQGACFMHKEGGASGNLALRMAPDGSMLVGGTNRGWGSRGNKPFSLERLVWTGKVPFEIHEMHARPDGFELTFTEEVDPKTAADPMSYAMTTYAYIFQSSYGSPEVDHATPKIIQAVVAADRRSVRLKVDSLQEGHIHELHVPGLRSKNGLPLLHKEAYYTLNYIPE